MAEIKSFPSRLGDQDLAASGDSAEANYNLFLKKFSGEVLTTFKEKQVFRGLHRVRTISSGKSAQFPVVGTASANFHIPGESIIQSDDGASGPKYLSEVRHEEKIILVDHARQASVLVAELDELMNHYETRSIYATELGEALANKADSTWAVVAAMAARAGATLTGGNGGAQLTKDYDNATASTRAGHYMDAIYEAAQTLDEKDVPKDGRAVVIDPATYYLLLREKSAELIDQDVSPGNGSVAGATMKMAGGMPIYVTNHLAKNDTVISAGETGARNDYSGTFTDSFGLCFHKDAFGTVELKGLTFEMEYSIEYQAYLMVAKAVWGSNVLRPECAVEFQNA